MKFGLWIDDKRPVPRDHETHWFTATTSNLAIALLRSGVFDVISFDHDLGGDDTAMRVVDYIDEQVSSGRMVMPEVRVHSQNPVGADNIRRALRRIAQRNA